MPSDENIEKYRYELNLLDTLYTYYSSFGTCNVLIAGDLNASCLTKDFNGSNKVKSQELLKLVNIHSLSYAGGRITHVCPSYTYTTKQTMLDYILLDDTLYRNLRSSEILAEGTISSTSDHLPILTEIETDYDPHCVLRLANILPAWHKATDSQIHDYQNFLIEPINGLVDKMNSVSICTDVAYDDFVSILYTAANHAIPKCGFNKCTKPYWKHMTRTRVSTYMGNRWSSKRDAI